MNVKDEAIKTVEQLRKARPWIGLPKSVNSMRQSIWDYCCYPRTPPNDKHFNIECSDELTWWIGQIVDNPASPINNATNGPTVWIVPSARG